MSCTSVACRCRRASQGWRPRVGSPAVFFFVFFFFPLLSLAGRVCVPADAAGEDPQSVVVGPTRAVGTYVPMDSTLLYWLTAGVTVGRAWSTVSKCRHPSPSNPTAAPPTPPPNQLARERPGMHPSISVRKSTAGIGPSGYRGLSSCTWGRCADGTGRTYSTYARSGVATALEPLAPAHVNARRPSPAPANRRRRPWRPSSASWRSRPPPGGVPPARRVNTRCGGRCLRFNKVRTGGFRVRSLTAGALRAPPAHAQRARARPLWRRRRRLGAVDGAMSSSAHLS